MNELGGSLKFPERLEEDLCAKFLALSFMVVVTHAPDWWTRRQTNAASHPSGRRQHWSGVWRRYLVANTASLITFATTPGCVIIDRWPAVT
jgi:hypothetical protein